MVGAGFGNRSLLWKFIWMSGAHKSIVETVAVPVAKGMGRSKVIDELGPHVWIGMVVDVATK